jgi:hypothetical protein
MDDIFNTDELINSGLNYLIEKIHTPLINEKIQHELIKPLTELIIKHMYPYLITTIVIIALMFISIIGIFILILNKPRY